MKKAKVKNKKAQDFEPAQIIMTVMLIVAAAGVVFGWNVLFKGQKLAGTTLELEEREVSLGETQVYGYLYEMLETKDNYGTKISRLIVKTEYEDDDYKDDTNYEYDSNGDGTNDADLSSYTETEIADFLDKSTQYDYYYSVKLCDVNEGNCEPAILSGNRNPAGENMEPNQEAVVWLPSIEGYKIRVYLKLQ